MEKTSYLERYQEEKRKHAQEEAYGKLIAECDEILYKEVNENLISFLLAPIYPPNGISMNSKRGRKLFHKIVHTYIAHKSLKKIDSGIEEWNINEIIDNWYICYLLQDFTMLYTYPMKKPLGDPYGYYIYYMFQQEHENLLK